MASSGFPQTIAWAKTGKPSSGPFTKVYPEKAAMSAVKKGDPIVLDSAGRVGSAADSGNVFGIADQDFSGTVDTPRKVTIVGHEDILFASQSNAGATQASAQTQVGLRCSYIKSTITGQTAKMTIDTADTSTPSVEIIGLRDPAGTQDGEVYFRFVQGLISAR